MAGTQSGGGSKVIRPEVVSPAVPSASGVSTFQAVGLPAASTAVGYSSTAAQPPAAGVVSWTFISRKRSG